MAPALTFGVEFEFALGTIKYKEEIPESETRTLWIEPSEADINGTDDYGWVSTEDYPVSMFTVQSHIAQTLDTAGFPVDLEEPFNDNVRKWTVKSDSSIGDPTIAQFAKRSLYQWHGVEITSPAFYYSEEALEHTAKFLKLLKKNYFVFVNETCGLHVHIGNGKTGFNQNHIRNLLAFFWAFEPQLDTLHPEARQLGHDYCRSLRNESNWALQFRRDMFDETGSDRFPTAAEGIMHFLDHKISLIQILEDGMPHNAIKIGKYNFSNIYGPMTYSGQWEEGPEATWKRTIEFRQHEGSLDEARVVNWVRTCTGIVDFIRQSVSAPLDLKRLLTFVARESNAKKPLATNDFTVIKLLRSIGQSAAAEFYQNRGLYKLKWSQEAHDGSDNEWESGGVISGSSGAESKHNRAPPEFKTLDYRPEAARNTFEDLQQQTKAADQGGMHPDIAFRWDSPDDLWNMAKNSKAEEAEEKESKGKASLESVEFW